MLDGDRALAREIHLIRRARGLSWCRESDSATRKPPRFIELAERAAQEEELPCEL